MFLYICQTCWTLTPVVPLVWLYQPGTECERSGWQTPNMYHYEVQTVDAISMSSCLYGAWFTLYESFWRTKFTMCFHNHKTTTCCGFPCSLQGSCTVMYKNPSKKQGMPHQLVFVWLWENVVNFKMSSKKELAKVGLAGLTVREAAKAPSCTQTFKICQTQTNLEIS